MPSARAIPSSDFRSAASMTKISTISSMPEALQYISYADPLRYFLVVLRGVYLKGVGLEVLWAQMAMMAVIGVTLLTISVLRFHKSLD